MNEKIRFIIVGGYNTAFGYGVFVLLYWWFHDMLHYLFVVAVAHAIAVLNSFVTQRCIVFKDRSSIFPAFFRFNIATTAMLVFSLAGMALLVDGVGIHPLISQAMVTPASVIGVYILHRKFTFKRHPKAANLSTLV